MGLNIAVVTIVRDDDFYLTRWVRYYGGLFGEKNLFVVNHGDQPSVRDIAGGCNLMPIPDGRIKKFNVLAWRTRNHMLGALIQWYDVVIVCDVDEFLAVDPDTGHDLRSWLDSDPRETVRTALGLEVVHRPRDEPDSIDDRILGPRRHVKINSHYNKPCIMSRQTKLSRGGHYAEYDKLDMPDFLFMFHLKFVDYDLYADTLNRRQGMVKSMNVDSLKDTTTNVQWFAQNRDDAKLFRDFEDRKVRDSFDFKDIRRKLRKSFGPRGHGLYHSKKPHRRDLHLIPERFYGIF